MSKEGAGANESGTRTPCAPKILLLWLPLLLPAFVPSVLVRWRARQTFALPLIPWFARRDPRSSHSAGLLPFGKQSQNIALPLIPGAKALNSSCGRNDRAKQATAQSTFLGLFSTDFCHSGSSLCLRTTPDLPVLTASPGNSRVHSNC